MSNKSLSIPIMPPKKIALCLSQLECHFDPDQVDNPHNLEKAYATFLEWLMGISPDEMDEFRAMTDEMQPLHEEGVKNVLLARHVQNLFRAVCIDHHNVIKDHIKPSQKRVLHALSQIINFAIYREERITTFQQLSSESEQIASKRLECEQRHEDLLAELEHLKVQRAEAEPVIQSLSSDNRGLAEEIAELHSKESSLQKENSHIEQEIEEVNRQNMKCEEDVNTLQQQIKRLKLQVVESPEKTQQYIEDLRHQITSNLKELSDINQRHRDHLTYFEALNKAQKEVEKTSSLVNVCTTAKEKGLEPKKEIKETEIKIEEAERRIKELKTENEHFQKLIKHEEENAQYVGNRYRSRITAAEQRLQNENRKFQITQRESTETQLKIKANSDQIRNLEQEKAGVVRKHNEDMSSLKQQFDDLENSVNDYQRRLLSATNGPL